MDFTKLIQYLNSLYDTFRKDWKFFSDSQIDAIKENTQAIENKEVVEEVLVKNPTDIEPLVEAQNATTEAIKAIPSVEIPKTDFTSLEDKILALKDCLEKKEMSVNIGKTIVDTQGVIKAIEKLPKMMPKMEEKEMTDYTLMLDGIMKLLERPKDHSEIKKLQELVKKLGTTEDLFAIAEWLKIIALKEYPEPQELPIKDGRVLVSVDRVGGGGSGGLTAIETGYLKEIAENTADIEINADTINLNTDDLEDNQTNGNQKTQLVNADNVVYDTNNPLPVDGDSVYIKDIDVANSYSTGWIAAEPGNTFLDLFDCPNDVTGLYNDTTTNPKVLYIAFCRTLYTNAIGLGCNLVGKTFSNVKFEFIGSDGTVRNTKDFSSDSTKRGTYKYDFDPIACVAVKISFLTTNTDIGLSNITIQKETAVTARIRGLKPNNIIADVGVTYGGSLKSSISDDLDFPSFNTPTGELRMVEPIRLVGAGFEGTTIDTNFWTTGATGAGASIAQSGCELVLTSGTASGSLVYGYSVRRARYVTGSSMRFRCVGTLTDGNITNNRRRWGVGWGASMPTITDGAWFQLDGGTLSVVTCKGGSETKVTTFNGVLGQYVLSAGTVATTEIYYTNSTIKFVLGGLTLHTVTANATSWTNTLAFHAFTDNYNSDTTLASTEIHARTASIYRLGKYETQPIYYHLAGNAATHVLKLGAGVLHKIIFNNTSGTNITIVDNVTGASPVMGIITTTSACIGEWDYSLAFNTGLILITTGNSLDATIVYE